MSEKITKYVAGWFARADDDLTLVKLILEKGTGSPNLACFHAQQAAEKYLKGFLAQHDLHVRKIHDVEILIEDCKNVDQSFAESQDDAKFLNQFYIESRYPDDYIEFTSDDAQKALRAALHIKEFVLSKIQNQSSSSGFGLLTIIIVVAVITLLAGGGFYVKELKQQHSAMQMGIEAKNRAEELKQKIEQQQQILQEQKTPTPTPKITMSTPVPSGVEGWKIYRNDKYGFEVKYPPTWEVAPDYRNGEIIGYDFSPKAMNSTSPDITIDFAGRRGIFSSSFEYYKIIDGHRLGIHDLSHTNLCPGLCLYGTFIFEPDQEPKGWSFYGSGFDLVAPDDFGKKLLMQILSTFKFTK